MCETIQQARIAFWHAFVEWYHVFNDDKASLRRTADTMKRYLVAKRMLREIGNDLH